MGDPVGPGSDDGLAEQGGRDLGEPVILARFNNLQRAHMVVAKLESEGYLAEVEPSNTARGFAAPFAVFPLGIGVMVPQSQAEAAYGHLLSADLLETPDLAPSRLVLQARDAMWLAAATIPLFFLSPISYLWASATRRELDRVREEMPGDDLQLAWGRAVMARRLAVVGLLIFAAFAALFLGPALGI